MLIKKKKEGSLPKCTRLNQFHTCEFYKSLKGTDNFNAIYNAPRKGREAFDDFHKTSITSTPTSGRDSTPTQKETMGKFHLYSQCKNFKHVL